MNVNPSEAARELPRVMPVVAPSPWRPYWIEAKYETLRALRMPGFALPFLILPAGLYLLFAVVLFGTIKDPKAALQIFTGFAVFGVMGPGVFGFGMFVALEREQGLLTLKRALPAPPAAYLLAKMVMALLFSVIVMVSLIAAGLFAGLTLNVWQWLQIGLIDVAGALPFCALGLFVGVRASGKSAPAYANLIFQPMIYLSGLFYPLPRAIQWIPFGSPAYYLEQLAANAAGLPTRVPALVSVTVLVAVTLGLTWLALRRLARAG